MSSRLTLRHFRVHKIFHGDSQGNTQMLRVSRRAIAVDLAASTERVSSQTNKICLCKSVSPFTMGHYGSPYDYVIYIAIIATSCVPPITFQPPLS